MNKKVVTIGLISLLVILVVIGGIMAWKYTANNLSKPAFSDEDLTMSGINDKTTLEELTNILGNPESKSEYMEGTTGDKIAEYIYESGKVNIIYRDRNDGNGFKIESVSSKSDQYTFARDLKVGVSKQTVLNAFPETSRVKGEELEKQNKIKYRKEQNNSAEITYMIQNDVVTEISWNVQQ